MTMDIDMTMTDDMQNTPNDSPPKKTGIGARLRSAREAIHLSEKDAAARMHLSVKYITDMENEDFRNGAPVTFMRGYLRSYARIVKLPDEEVNEAIEQLGMNAPTKTAPIPVLRTPTLDNNERYVRWGTYLIVLILVGLVVVWWSTHSREMIADLPSKPAAPTAQAPAQPAQPVPAQPVPVQPGAAQPASAQPMPAQTPPIDQTTGQPAANQATPGIAPTNTTPVAVVPGTPAQPGVNNVAVPAPPVGTTNPAQAPLVAPGPQPMNPDGTTIIPTPTNKAQTNQSDDDSSDDDDEPAPKAKRHSDIIQHMQMNRPEPGLDNDNDYDY